MTSSHMEEEASVKAVTLKSCVLVDDGYLNNAFKVGRLGKGSYGKINLVRTRDNRVHAIKYVEIPYRGLSQSQLAETNTLMRFRNAESIIQLTGICYALPPRLAVLLEPMDRDLYNLLRKTEFEVRMTLLETLFQSMITALSHLEAFNMYHLDIKPHNILVRVEAGKTIFKLADFGLARIAPVPFLLTKNVAYSLPYRPPEFLAGNAYTYRKITGDIWALALVLIEFITGHAVFLAKTDDQMLKLIGNEGLKANDLIRVFLPLEPFRQIPSHLVDTITGMLTVNPEKRPTASELLFPDAPKVELYEKFSSPLYPRSYHQVLVPFLIKIGTNGGMSKASILIAVELLTRYLAISADLTEISVIIFLLIASEFFDDYLLTAEDLVLQYLIVTNKRVNFPIRNFVEVERKILLDLNFEIYDTHLTVVIQRAYNNNIKISTIDPITFSQPITDWLQ